MILEEKAGIVKSSGVLNTTEFRIAASAKMFSMLTDGLYSNKIESIVRELSSNAWDSHVEAGHKKQFVIHAPTYNEQNFSIRDYGLGLSPEKVEEVYTVLGVSDKIDSNEFVGCLGIGSKSPFSYTNNFSVTSFNNGKKRMYCCYKNEEGIPAISLLSEEDSNEPSGLLIEIAVPYKDLSLWVKAIEKNYLFYDVLPKCNIPIKQADKKLEFTLNNIEVYSYTNSSYGYGSTQILMGHNIYKLDKVFAGVEFDIPYGKHLVFNVPIGTVSVDISRERLQFDKKTEAALTKMMSNVKDYLLKSVQDDINKASCEYEAAKAIRELDGIKLRNFYNLLTYKGKKMGEVLSKTEYSPYLLFRVHHKAKCRKSPRFSFTHTDKIIIDDKKVSHTKIAYDYLKEGESAYFFKPKEDVRKCADFVNGFGIPDKYIIFTSSINLQKGKTSYAPIKLMQLKDLYLTQVVALPTDKDYYIMREGNNITLSKSEKLIVNMLGITVYALTKTQVKKYGCKDLTVELPNLVEAYLKKNGITQNYSGVVFNYYNDCHNLCKIAPDLKSYMDMYDDYIKAQQSVDKIVPQNLKSQLLSKLPVKKLNIDALLLEKYPLMGMLRNTGYLTPDCEKDLEKYFKEKDNEFSGNQNK